MKDMRLKEVPFELGGKTYLLRCNMNVLADVQEANDGELISVLDGKKSMRTLLEFLAPMLNDYADEMGWPERFTSRSLGRIVKNAQEIPGEEIMELVMDAMIPDAEEDAQDEEAPDEEAPEEGAKTGN